MCMHLWAELYSASYASGITRGVQKMWPTAGDTKKEPWPNGSHGSLFGPFMTLAVKYFLYFWQIWWKFDHSGVAIKNKVLTAASKRGAKEAATDLCYGSRIEFKAAFAIFRELSMEQMCPLSRFSITPFHYKDILFGFVTIPKCWISLHFLSWW